MSFTLIAVADKNWGIGKNGGLLFSIPEDMKFFRRTTTGATVIMGRKTLESFPGGKPLPNRKNIVLTRNTNYAADGVCVIHDPKDALNEDNAFVIGGAEIYSLLLPYCDRALITKVDALGDADVFIPDFDSLPDWKLASVSEPIESNGYTITFNEYIRI